MLKSKLFTVYFCHSFWYRLCSAPKIWFCYKTNIPGIRQRHIAREYEDSGKFYLPRFRPFILFVICQQKRSWVIQTGVYAVTPTEVLQYDALRTYFIYRVLQVNKFLKTKRIDNFRETWSVRDPDIYYGMRISKAMYVVK